MNHFIKCIVKSNNCKCDSLKFDIKDLCETLIKFKKWRDSFDMILSS